MEIKDHKIEITENGPYHVTGDIPIAEGTIIIDDHDFPTAWKIGDPLPSKHSYLLCRCGHSKHKPFCDDTHLKIKFDGTETAGKKNYDDFARTIEGPDLILKDAKVFCASARFCDRAGGVWHLVENSDNPRAKENAILETWHCPSGRLVLKDKNTGLPVEPQMEPSITIVEYPDTNIIGPIRVTGGIELKSSDGSSYEVRNRMTLCRCGKSGNKPFCDGSHLKGKMMMSITKFVRKIPF